MRRDVLRFWGWVGVVVVLMLVSVSGCTRSKSSGPPEITPEEGAQAASPQPVDGQPTATLTVDQAQETAAAALAATTTAEAAAQETQPTATATPEATVSVTPTSTTPTATATAGPTATPTPALTPATATTSPATGTGTHTVQAGENLYRIALQYGLTYQQLAAHNGIANPNFIVAGQVLEIPSSGGTTPPPSGGNTYHTVQQDENLFRIALKYNMLYTALAAANGLSYPYTIYPGQQLIIP